jgi:cytochrome c oxidase subunit 4
VAHEHQPMSPRGYVAVYVALLALTALTAGLVVASDRGALHLDSRVEVVIALGIATAKTALVGWYFMHLMHAGRLIYLFIAGGVLFLLVMLSLTLADYWTRDWFPWSPPYRLTR